MEVGPVLSLGASVLRKRPLTCEGLCVLSVQSGSTLEQSGTPVLPLWRVYRPGPAPGEGLYRG